MWHHTRNGITTPTVERTMNLTYTMRQVKNSLFWGCVNACFLSVVLYDIMYTCPFYSDTFILFEYGIAMFLGINTLFHFGRYLWTNVNMQPIEMTPIQKKLLGIRNGDSFVKVKEGMSSSIISTPDNCPSTPMNVSSCSWLSSPTFTSVSDFDDSKLGSNYSVSSSWVCMPGSPHMSPTGIHQSPTSTPVSSANRYQNGVNLIGSDSITDEASLSQYLKEYNSFEKGSVVGVSMEQPSNLLSTFWSHPVTRSSAEVAPLLRRCAYQLAISTPEQTTNTIRSSDETGSSLHCDAEIWRRLKINPNSIIQWTANLRMWISQTILERLVSEIKSVNNALQAYGFTDICIGEVGLDRLRKTAQTLQVVQNIPSLPCLVPFLEVSPNQEYVVSRIRDLARGGCMSEFKWNSGGSLDRKEWGEHLPTDAALVLHLWATYLDSLLPPLPSMPDRHPFSSLYLVKSPNKPTKVSLAISEVTKNPSHYQLVTGDEVHHVPKGRNNLFYTILLFLHHIKTKEHGMLGRMNLGRSGVNMLWVIES